MNLPFLEGIFLAFILENDTLEEYVKVRKKASYIRKKLLPLFLKKLCLDKRENENDKYYDYKRSSGYATLSKNAQPPWFDCGSNWNRENRYLKSDN